MKKLILSLVLVAGFFSAAATYAETLPAAGVNVKSVKKIIDGKYTAKIDKDSDIAITTENGIIYISVLKDVKLVRIFSIFKPYTQRSLAEVIVLANQFNNAKRLLRVYVLEDGGSSCDYYMTYDGGLNSENLLSCMEWFCTMEQAWCEYVINGGGE